MILSSQLMKMYLMSFLLNERGIVSIVIKRANQFVSFKIGDVQLLDLLNFLGGTTRLDSFLKAYRTSKTTKIPLYQKFSDPENLTNTQLPSYENFFSELRNNDPLEKDHSDFQNLKDGNLTCKDALSKLKLRQAPATGQTIIST